MASRMPQRTARTDARGPSPRAKNETRFLSRSRSRSRRRSRPASEAPRRRVFAAGVSNRYARPSASAARRVARLFSGVPERRDVLRVHTRGRRGRRERLDARGPKAPRRDAPRALRRREAKCSNVRRTFEHFDSRFASGRVPGGHPRQTPLETGGARGRPCRAVPPDGDGGARRSARAVRAPVRFRRAGDARPSHSASTGEPASRLPRAGHARHERVEERRLECVGCRGGRIRRIRRIRRFHADVSDVPDAASSPPPRAVADDGRRTERRTDPDPRIRTRGLGGTRRFRAFSRRRGRRLGPSGDAERADDLGGDRVFANDERERRGRLFALLDARALGAFQQIQRLRHPVLRPSPTRVLVLPLQREPGVVRDVLVRRTCIRERSRDVTKARRAAQPELPLLHRGEVRLPSRHVRRRVRRREARPACLRSVAEIRGARALAREHRRGDARGARRRDTSREPPAPSPSDAPIPRETNPSRRPPRTSRRGRTPRGATSRHYTSGARVSLDFRRHAVCV